MEESFSNAFIRNAMLDLKKENRCFCYFEWQVKEITDNFEKKYGESLKVKKRDGYYLICKN